ncbi:MAG: hypothetical protein HKN32_00995, partial [Flavobacteriales bacterium]|nr:hypothetical protein [Flavobacteriales bacterium]
MNTDDALNRLEGVFANANTLPISISSIGPEEFTFINTANGVISGDDIELDSLAAYPEHNWDSWITINVENNSQNENVVVEIGESDAFELSFDTSLGQDFFLEEGSWYPGLSFEANAAGDDFSLLLGQVTSSEGLCGIFNTRLRYEDNSDFIFDFHGLTACSWPYNGCQDPDAINFNPLTIQPEEECIYSEDYGVLLEAIYSDDGTIPGYPVGYTTYELYLTVQNSNDQLLSVFGDKFVSPMSIISSCEIFNHEYGSWLLSQIDQDLIQENPLLAFDSYLTIGTSSESNALVDTQWDGNTQFFIDDVGPDQVFGIGGENGLVLSDSRIFSSCGATSALGGDLFKIKIAQITTNGQVSGSINVKLALSGDCENIA